MAGSGQETEAKFYIRDLAAIRARLHELEARLIQPRVLETNLRFDLPDGSLRSKGSVLRLRRDTESRLTYKGAGQNNQGVLHRQEIEFVASDFEQARQFLEALGYRQSMVYEKYRTTYELDDASVMLDELPYGTFLEIEGQTLEKIQAIAASLHLRWDTAIGDSYTGLFERLRKSRELAFGDLVFGNFEGIAVTPGELGVQPADG